MPNQTKEEVVPRGITARSLTLSAIIFIITYVIFFYSFHPRVGGSDMWFWHYLVYLGWRWYFGWETILFPMMIIFSLLALASKKFALTKQEWTIVYAVATIVVPSTFWWGIWAWCMNPMLGTERFKHLIDYVPANWVPKKFEILAAFWESRNPYQWTIPYAGAWTGPIITWVLFYVIVNLWLYGLVLIFRKRMIEVEKLPYPVTTTTLTVINLVTTPVSEGSKRSIIWSKKALFFWIGFLLAIFYDVFYLFPGWIFKRPPFTIPGDIDLQGKFPPFQRSVLSYFVTPVQLGLYFLFSLDILLTATIFHVIFLIIVPAILVSVGVFPSTPTSEWGAMWGTYFNTKLGLAGTYSFALNAMTIGVALYLIFYTRSTWIGLFKKFLSGEEEPGEPVSPRFMWTLFIVGGVLFLAWMVASGIHVIASILAIIYILIIWFAVIRYAGEAWNDPILPWGFRLQQYDRMFSYYVSSALTGNASTTGYGMAFVVSNLTCYQPHSSVIPALFSFKMAEETKTDPKEIVKIQIPTLILASILSVVIGWYTIGIQGLRNWAHGWTTSWDGALNNGLGAANTVVRWTQPPADIAVISAIIGIIAGAVLMFLRTTFAWFIINPIAVPLLSLLNFYTSFSAIVAFILKFLVVKIGGTKVYEEYGVPLAVGAFFGSFLCWHIGYPLVLLLRIGWRVLPI